MTQQAGKLIPTESPVVPTMTIAIFAERESPTFTCARMFAGIFPMAVAPPTLRVLAVEEAEDLRLRNTFACSLRRLFSLPGSPFRCTFEQAWTTADRDVSQCAAD